MSALAPCTSCARHVRRHEAACPFCGATLSLASLPAPRVMHERLGRAALFTVGAAIATSTGCAVALYGAPPRDTDIAQADAAALLDAGTDGGGGTLYGAPPDAAAADVGTDAADDDTGAPAAEYGAPPAP